MTDQADVASVLAELQLTRDIAKDALFAAERLRADLEQSRKDLENARRENAQLRQKNGELEDKLRVLEASIVARRENGPGDGGLLEQGPAPESCSNRNPAFPLADGIKRTWEATDGEACKIELDAKRVCLSTKDIAEETCEPSAGPVSPRQSGGLESPDLQSCATLHDSEDDEPSKPRVRRRGSGLRPRRGELPEPARVDSEETSPQSMSARQEVHEGADRAGSSATPSPARALVQEDPVIEKTITRTHEEDLVSKLALFSPCERYRYLLRHAWDPSRPRVLMIMQSPSVADEKTADQTVKRFAKWARNEGYGAIAFTNLFALIASKGKGSADLVGPANDEVLRAAASWADHVVCAWGTKGAQLGREDQVIKLLGDRDLLCFGTTAEGQPRNPMRQANSVAIVRWQR